MKTVILEVTLNKWLATGEQEYVKKLIANGEAKQTKDGVRYLLIDNQD